MSQYPGSFVPLAMFRPKVTSSGSFDHICIYCCIVTFGVLISYQKNLSAFCSYVPELNRELTMVLVTCREKFKIEGHHHRFSQVGIWGNFFD